MLQGSVVLLFKTVYKIMQKAATNDSTLMAAPIAHNWLARREKVIGIIAPILITISGLTDDEMPTHDFVLLPIRALSPGGNRVSVAIIQMVIYWLWKVKEKMTSSGSTSTMAAHLLHLGYELAIVTVDNTCTVPWLYATNDRDHHGSEQKGIAPDNRCRRYDTVGGAGHIGIMLM